MTHTPGPWKRYRDKNGRVSKIEGKGYRVCTFQPSDPNTNNDSALIEAAPDMLRALEAACGESEESDYLMQAQIQAMCRSAIQKARGEK